MISAVQRLTTPLSEGPLLWRVAPAAGQPDFLILFAEGGRGSHASEVDDEMLDRLRIAGYCRSALLWSWPDSFGAASESHADLFSTTLGCSQVGKVAVFWKLVEIEMRRPVQLSGTG